MVFRPAQVWTGSDWDDIGDKRLKNGYAYNSTVYFTSNGTFTKADYPWLRAIRVRLVGGGGGGGGAPATGSGELGVGTGGGGAAYAEKFLLATSIGASETVTVGGGGAGGAAGINNGASGGTTTFTVDGGTNISAAGGSGGASNVLQPPNALDGALGGVTVTGADFSVKGTRSDVNFVVTAGAMWPSLGGASYLGNSQNAVATGTGANGNNAADKGAGGNGGINAQNQGTARTGGNGAAGIVIVELFA